MKYIIFSLLFFISCATVQKPDCPPPVQCPKCYDLPITKVTVNNGKGQQDLVLSKEEFLSIYRLAKQYVALRDSVNNATVEKNVTVQKIADDQYNVTIKIDEHISITAVVHIDNEELKELREKMHRITTVEPTVLVERLRTSKFKITLSVDDVKFTTEVDIDQTRGFDVQSFLTGTAAGVVLAALFGKFAVAKLALLLVGL